MKYRVLCFVLALMLAFSLLGGVAANAETAASENEIPWLLLKFSYKENPEDENSKDVVRYALVGEGNGEDAFRRLSPTVESYSQRYAALWSSLKRMESSLGSYLLEISAKPESISFEAGEMEHDGHKHSYTKILFNGDSVLEVDGDVAFAIVSWTLGELKPEKTAEKTQMYIWEPSSCRINSKAAELCPGCGLLTVHGTMFCGHRACAPGNHGPAGCGAWGHFACYGWHYPAPCKVAGHCACWGNHGAAACNVKGHLACVGEHSKCPGCAKLLCDKDYKAAEHEKLACGHYECDGKDHSKADCGHYVCGKDFVAEKHFMMFCGHYMCADGDHSIGECNLLGHFKCDGKDHSKCEPVTCPGCGVKMDVTVMPGDHILLDCGHYVCQSGNHTEAPCGHFYCQEGTHEQSGCGHYICIAGKEHVQLDCGHYECVEADHNKAGCGHFACVEGTHEQSGCGHYICIAGKEHVQLECGHYECVEADHNKAGCGHFACVEGTHKQSGCGHYICIAGKEHVQLGCGHFECNTLNHSLCGKCGGFLCVGDHTACVTAFAEPPIPDTTTPTAIEQPPVVDSQPPVDTTTPTVDTTIPTEPTVTDGSTPPAA